jgi:hypothetical protein
MARKEPVDVMNEAVLRAAEMAFRGLEQFLAQAPRPIGVDPGTQRMTVEEFRRLTKGI